MGTLIDCWSWWTVFRRLGTKMISFFVFFFFFAAATHAFPSDPLNFNPSMVRQDGPLNMEALNMLHADAVKFGAGAKDNKWFAAVDAKTLDGMITEMNTMNRWFAKVVKYWDDFTSGGDGAKVLAEQGKGINEDEPVDGAVDPPADGDDPPVLDGDDGTEPGDDGADPAADGEEPAGEDGDEPTDGEEPADGEDPEADGDGDKEAADGDKEAAETKDGAEDDEEGKGEDKEDDARKRRMKKRRMRKRL